MPENQNFQHLVDILAKLRGPGGCPWDREQTHQSLRQYVVEEAYEVVDAIEQDDYAHLREELGDLLLQVVFQAQIASEEGKFSIGDVLSEIVAKLERRHPHVFGELEVSTAEEVLKHWYQIKAEEKGGRPKSALEGVPKSLPALLQAFELQKKAARVGFDWESKEGVLKKLLEEVGELTRETGKGGDVEGEIGDLLFSAVNVARHYGANAELALLRVCRKFKERFAYMEQQAASQSLDFEKMSLAEKDRLWDQAKEALDKRKRSNDTEKEL